jgi:hypothetical protein
MEQIKSGTSIRVTKMGRQSAWKIRENTKIVDIKLNG